jgi:NADPH2:quinone reductase
VRAAQVRGFGDIDAIDLVEIPRPHPGAGEVLVRIKACGLNYSDALQRQGLYLGGPRPPFVPGVEAAGIVERNGAADSAIPVGTRVAVLASGGLHAEWAVGRANDCIPLPDSMSFTEGAAFPVQYLTAYHALTTVARASAGETVLIHAAGGGLGTAAVQIARLLGLVVVATASTETKRERVRELGAARAVGYDAFVEAVRELTGGRGPDIILESVGGDVFRRSLAVLPPLGRLIVLGAASGEIAPIDVVRLLFRSQGILGFHLNALLCNPGAVRTSVDRLLRWVQQGDLKMQIGEAVAFDDIRRAHRLLASRDRYGKIVLVWE